MLAPKYLDHPIRADRHTFFLPSEGIIKIKYNLIDFTVAPGSLCLLAPDIVHQVTMEDNAEMLAVGFSYDLFSRFRVAI